MRKQFLACMAGAALALSVVACSGGGGEGNQSESQAPGGASDSATPDGAGQSEDQGSSAGQGGGKEVVFWDAVWGGSEYTAAAKALAAQYTAETGVNVVYQQIPWDAWLQTWSTAFASGTGPDVATGSALLQHRYFPSGNVDNLDDLAATYDPADFTNGAWENFQYDGHQIAIPFNVDYRALWYRSDLFEAAGVEPPTNWDEFRAAAQALTHDNQYGYVMAGTDQMGSWQGLFWTINNGSSWLGADLNPDFANQGTIQALEFVRSLGDDGLIPPGSASYSSADAIRVFLAGEAAMIMEGPALAENITSDELESVIEVMEPLKSPSGEQINVGSANGLILFTAATERGVRDESVAFIDWWSKNNQTLWTEGNMGAFPARLSLMDAPRFTESKYPASFLEKVVPKTVLYSYPHPSAAIQMDIMDGEQFYKNIIQEILTTSRPLEEILNDATDRYQQALDQLMGSIS